MPGTPCARIPVRQGQRGRREAHTGDVDRTQDSGGATLDDVEVGVRHQAEAVAVGAKDDDLAGELVPGAQARVAIVAGDERQPP